MKKSYKIIGVSLIAASCFTLGVGASGTLTNISAYLNNRLNIDLNGEKFDAKEKDGSILYPITYNDRTYLPVRALSEKLGLEVSWDENTQTIVIEESDSLKYSFDFKVDNEGWDIGFADVPLDYKDNSFDLQYGHKDIPNKTDKGIMLKGQNRSDDLFMYITKKIDGLKPNSNYKVDLGFDLATNVPGGMMGVGGSPGSSVYVKAGVTNVAPKAIEQNRYFRMNIDTGSQSNGGEDMIVLGNVEKLMTDEMSSIDESFQYKPFISNFEVTTNENGEAFAIIGFDSGFEGFHELYFTNINLKFDSITN